MMNNFLLESYEDTYYTEKIINAGKAVNVERNYHMLDQSKFCVMFYNDKSKLQELKNKAGFTKNETKSGTRLAYEYAKRKGVFIINISDEK